MYGIWAAVKATTLVAGSPRKALLKLWKSRPAAPMMSTRRCKHASSRPGCRSPLGGTAASKRIPTRAASPGGAVPGADGAEAGLGREGEGEHRAVAEAAGHPDA